MQSCTVSVISLRIHLVSKHMHVMLEWCFLIRLLACYLTQGHAAAAATTTTTTVPTLRGSIATTVPTLRGSIATTVPTLRGSIATQQASHATVT